MKTLKNATLIRLLLGDFRIDLLEILEPLHPEFISVNRSLYHFYTLGVRLLLLNQAFPITHQNDRIVGIEGEGFSVDLQNRTSTFTPLHIDAGKTANHLRILRVPLNPPAVEFQELLLRISLPVSFLQKGKSLSHSGEVRSRFQEADDLPQILLRFANPPRLKGSPGVPHQPPYLQPCQDSHFPAFFPLVV